MNQSQELHEAFFSQNSCLRSPVQCISVLRRHKLPYHSVKRSAVSVLAERILWLAQLWSRVRSIRIHRLSVWVGHAMQCLRQAPVRSRSCTADPGTREPRARLAVERPKTPCPYLGCCNVRWLEARCKSRKSNSQWPNSLSQLMRFLRLDRCAVCCHSIAITNQLNGVERGK